MKIGLLQYDVAWQDVDSNLEKIASYLDRADSMDIIFLPEMFDTAYIMFPSKFDGFDPAHTIDRMRKLASRYSVTLAGSIPNRYESQYFNSFIYVDESGIIGQYDKVHLFSPAGEAKHYTSGTTDKDIKIFSKLIRSQVCYDLRFPYGSYNHTNYDLLAYVANWPRPRIGQWESLLSARAIENQAYTIGVNRLGVDANGYEYNGQSRVVDFSGQLVLDCGDTEGLYTVELDIEAMYKYRAKLPFLKDQKR